MSDEKVSYKFISTCSLMTYCRISPSHTRFCIKIRASREIFVNETECRQRQLSSSATPFSLAQKYLPRELLQNIRMPQPTKAKKPLRKLKTIGDAEEDGQ